LRRRDLDIDVLVNNAGFGYLAPLHEADAETLENEIQLNATTLVGLSHALLPAMLGRQRGAILNVASTAAFQPVPYMSVYGATKAFVLSFTEALWAETRRTGVRVTAICPGATDTTFFEVAGENASLGRRMSPERVVAVALRALERGRSTAVPGVGNRALTTLPRFAPRPVVARAAERTMRPRAGTTASVANARRALRGSRSMRSMRSWQSARNADTEICGGAVGFLDRIKGAAESAQAATSKVGVGAFQARWSWPTARRSSPRSASTRRPTSTRSPPPATPTRPVAPSTTSR